MGEELAEFGTGSGCFFAAVAESTDKGSMSIGGEFVRETECSADDSTSLAGVACSVAPNCGGITPCG